MTRKSSVEGDSGFVIVLRAHDHIWRSPLPLETKMRACQLIWSLVCKGLL